MIDAFGNTVPGWVVETSAVWDGVPTYAWSVDKATSGAVYSPNTGQCLDSVPVYVKQWKLFEFMAADGTKMQSLQIDSVFNNGKQIITMRGQTGDIDGFMSFILHTTSKQLMDSLALGEEFFMSYWWGDLSSTISPEDLAKGIFDFRNGMSPRPAWFDNDPCVTEIGCAMEMGQVGVNRFPRSYMQDILNGQYGEFVDLSQDTWISKWRKPDETK